MQVVSSRPVGRPVTFDRADAILAAARLFWRSGYSGTSTRSLSDALGLSTSSIYAAFGSKAGLFEEAVRTYGERYRAIYRAACGDPVFSDALTRLLRDSVEEFTQPIESHPGCLASSAAVADVPDVMDAGAYLAELQQSNEMLLRGRIERAQVEGEVSRSVDPAVLASLVQAVWHGLSAQSNQGAGRSELLVTADLAVDYVLARAPRS